MICGVLFSISSVADNLGGPKVYHVAFFYSGLLIQLYTNCFYGSQVFVMVRQCFFFSHFNSRIIAEYIIYLQSTIMGQSAYFSNWQDSGRQSYRIMPSLLMIMKRSLRACRLTAGKFASVDLPTFLSVRTILFDSLVNC